MADYRGGGGGGGGDSVVPASLVVADDREDYPLTEAGLAAAIAALPAGGGTIYLGQGTLTLTGTITLSKNIKIIGAGIGVTIISVSTAISIFTFGDVEVTLSDFSVVGNDTAGQKFITLTANATNSKLATLSNIRIGTTVGGFGAADGVRTVLDMASFARNWVISDFTYFVASATGAFLANGIASTMRLSNVSGNGSFAGSNMNIEAANWTLSASSGNITFGNQARLSNCMLIGANITFGSQAFIANCFLVGTIVFGETSTVSGGSLQGAVTLGARSKVTGAELIVPTVSMAASCILEGCVQNGASTAVTATGGGCKVLGCVIASFTCATAGADEHVIKGNTFTGAGNNVTLTDCDGCVVEGNIDCQVNETATSDGNIYNNNTGFSGSTIVGANSVVNGAKKFGGSGNTADAYATLFTHTNPKGLIGIGTVKNTHGSNSLTVEEQVIDAFGVTTVVENVVLAGDQYMLDPQTNFSTTSFPPHVSYRVRVKSTSVGNAASYSVQHASQGVLV